MLRKCTDEDISDEECEKIIDPFYDNYHTFVEEYVMPEVIAYYLANSFYRNTMCLNSISILFFICLILYVRIIKKWKSKLLNYSN